MNTSEMGIKGEMYCLQQLIKLGWSLEVNVDYKNIDFALKKRNKILKFQIKTSEKRTTFRISKNHKKNELKYLLDSWNFLLFTNLKDIWVLPYELLKRGCGEFVRVKGEYNCFKNRFNLLEMNDFQIKEFMLDNRITWN